MSEVVAAIKAGPKADVLVNSDPYNTTIGVFGLAMAAGGSVITWPHFMQRAFMAKNEKVMHVSAIAMPLAYLVIETGLYFLAAFVAPYAFPNWTSAEADEIVEAGTIEPENIVTPGALVDYIVERSIA